MADEPSTNGTEQFRRYLDDFLSTAAPGLEEVVNSKSFGEMLAQTAGNFVALHRIGNEAMDLTLRNLRVAGRSDVTSLHRQLARNEDKLELVLETVERLEDELADERRRNGESAAGASEEAPSSTTGERTGRPAPTSSPRRTSDQGE